MQRTAVNPWDWSLKVGYNQAEIIEDGSRQLICSGQTAVDSAGNPQHPGDMRGQISLAQPDSDGPPRPNLPPDRKPRCSPDACSGT